MHSNALQGPSISVAVIVAMGLTTLLHAGKNCPPCYVTEVFDAPDCGFPGFSPAPFARAINQSGLIVGDYNLSICSGVLLQDKAFVYTSEMGLQSIPYPPNSNDMSAYAVCDSGLIAGEMKSTLPGIKNVAYVKNERGIVEIGTLPGGNWSKGFGVNSAGLVVGEWGNTNGGVGIRAFRWDRTSMIDMQQDIGRTYSGATAINEEGTIVGWRADLPIISTQEPYTWKDGIVTFLPVPSAAVSAKPTGISSDGKVTGYSRYFDRTTRSYFVHACTWINGKVAILDCPPSSVETYAYGINAAGNVVGSDSVKEGKMGGGGVLWYKGTFYKFQDLLVEDGIFYDVDELYAINDAGVICGKGGYGPTGEDCSFKFTPLPSIVADINCDQVVDAVDLGQMLDTWGTENFACDLNDDGVVNGADLGLLLADWM